MKSNFLKWLFKLGRKRNLHKDHSFSTPLKRCLTTYHLIFYSIAHMAGAGVYVLTGSLIRKEAGPAAFLSYLIGATSAIFTSMCYAEFATLLPRAGSCYTYTYVIIGEFAAFVTGWIMLSDYIVGMASIAKGFSGTVNLISNNAISNWTLLYVGELSDNGSIFGEYLDLVACGFLIILILVVMMGAKSSLTINAFFTIVQILCLLSVSVACFFYGSTSNWQEPGGMFPFGFGGVVSGATIAVYAFAGFDSLANATEETINPRRSIPIALFVSLGIITCLYCIASLGLSYLIPKEDIDFASPFVAAFIEVDQPVFKWIAAVGTLLATGATKICSMYAVPRILYTMASDGLFLSQFAYIHPKTKVPIVALFFCGILSAILALLFNIQTLTEFVSLGILISYFMIGVNLIVLRYLRDDSLDTKNLLSSTESNNSLDIIDIDIAELSQYEMCFRINLLPNKWRRRKVFGIIFVIHLSFDAVIALLVIYITSISTTPAWTIVLGVLSLCGMLVTFLLMSLYKPVNLELSFSVSFNIYLLC